MKILDRMSALFTPKPVEPEVDPVCVQDGGLRAYIWPTRQHFSYEVVNSFGEKLVVGAEPSLEHARRHAMSALARLR